MRRRHSLRSLAAIAAIVTSACGCGLEEGTLEGPERIETRAEALEALGAAKPTKAAIRAALEALASGAEDGTCRGISVHTAKPGLPRAGKAEYTLALGARADDCDKPKKKRNDTDAVGFTIAPGARAQVRAELPSLTDDLDCVLFVRAPRDLDGEMAFTVAPLTSQRAGGGVYLEASPENTSMAGVVCTLGEKAGRLAPRTIPLRLTIQPLSEGVN